MKKLLILAAGGVGYVLGARAGRERYEQIRGMAMQAKSNPTVQQAAQQATEAAQAAAPVVKDKVMETAGAAADKVGGNDDAGGGVGMESSAYPINDADAKP